MRKHRLIWYYVIASVIIGVISLVAVFSFINNQRLIENSSLSQRADDIVLNTLRVQNALTDAESSIRGFLLSEDRLYLIPYTTSHERVAQGISNLINITTDEEKKRLLLDSLSYYANRRLVFADSLVFLMDSGQFEEALDRFHDRNGKITMEQLRNISWHIQDSQFNTLSQINEKRNFYYASTPIWQLTFSFLAIFFILLGIFFIRKQMRKQWATEEILSDKVNELDLSYKELEEFTFIASHDLQEPLRKIRIIGDRLQNLLKGDNELNGNDYIDQMQKSATRMQMLLDDLTIMAKYYRTTYEFVPQSLNIPLENAIKQLESEIKTKGAIVEVTELPQVEVAGEIMVHLFHHLIDNSLKFSKPIIDPCIQISGEVVSTSGDVMEKKKFCRIIYKDNGLGFSNEYREKIFETFEKLPMEIENTGTGVGLAICKRIVLIHKGTIEANSVEGEGTEIIITLPLYQTQLQAVVLEDSPALAV